MTAIRRTLPTVLTFAALAAGFVHAVSLPQTRPSTCHAVDVSDTSGMTEQDAQTLITAGWFGKDDGAERLYSPSCAVSFEIRR